MSQFSPHIAALYTYPIKGCAAVSWPSVDAYPTGLQHDRSFVVVDAGGVFLSQRSHPALALVTISLDAEAMHLSHPVAGELTVKLAATESLIDIQVWRDKTTGIDKGDAAAQWFSTVVNAPVRLAQAKADAPRLCKTANTPYFFADAYPYLVLSEGSVHDLNDRILQRGGEAVSANRFRANIVLGGVDPYTEDFISGFRWQGGEVLLDRPCVRCAVPNIVQETAQKDPHSEPNLTLASYRFNHIEDGVTFGINARLGVAQAQLRVGDAVTLHYSF